MHNTNKRPDYDRDRIDRNVDPRVNPSVQANPGSVEYDANLVNETPIVGNGVPVEPPAVAYEDGYVRGRNTELQRQEILETRDNDNAARGLLLGVLLTALVGAIVAAFFFIGQQNRTPAPVVVPAPDANNTLPVAPSVQPTTPTTNNTQIRERVIERTRVVPVPQPVLVPQPQAPAPAPAPVQQAPVVQPSPVAPTNQADPAASPDPNNVPQTNGTTEPAPPSGAPAQ